MIPLPQMPVACAGVDRIDPLVRANDFEAYFQRSRIDAHPLDGACSCPLAVFDLGPFESGTGWTGSSQHLLPVSKKYFGIRSDIDNQGHLVLQMWNFRQQHRHVIGAVLTRDARQDMNASRSVGGRQTQVASLRIKGPANRQGKRSPSEFDRIDTQKQMMHHAVAHQNQIEDVLR